MNCPLSCNLRSGLISVWIISDLVQASSPAAQADTEIWDTDDIYARSGTGSVGKHRNTPTPFVYVFLDQKGKHWIPFQVPLLHLAQLGRAERFQHQACFELRDLLSAITFIVCKKTQHSFSTWMTILTLKWLGQQGIWMSNLQPVLFFFF